MSDHKVVLDEHERLEVLVRDLRMVSNWEPDLLKAETVRRRLAGDLESLQVRLREHFDTEESGSYLDEIRSRNPSAAVILKQVQQEHGVMLERLSALQGACTGAGEGSGAPEAIQQRLTEILDMLHRHERRETALINEVFRN